MVSESLVFEALLDWNPWGHFKEEIKEREVVPEPRKRVVLAIKGVRRCGKSRLAYLIGKGKERGFLLINFEDPRLRDVEPKEILKIVEVYQKNVNEKLPSILVLDEVQNICGWEKVARLYSEVKGVKVIVTGSSSKLMSEEYATVLTGRHLDFELFPLSFREVLSWKGIGKEKLKIYKHKINVLKSFDEFMKFGGFPEVFLTEDKRDKMLLLREYFNDIIFKDVVKRFRVREIEKIENLAKLYLTNISTLQSFNKIKNIVGLSLDSVERFSKYFETARLFFFIPKFGYSITQQILSAKKVYCIDPGFFTAIGFKFSQNIGRLMENLVAVELLRRKSYWNPGTEVFYWKDYQQREVDFVVKEGLGVKELIQVTYANGFDEVENRELRSLVKASELLRCKNLLVITWDYEGEEEFKGKRIRFVPLWKWLLE